jgi:hypothetical protein
MIHCLNTVVSKDLMILFFFVVNLLKRCVGKNMGVGQAAAIEESY